MKKIPGKCRKNVLLLFSLSTKKIARLKERHFVRKKSTENLFSEQRMIARGFTGYSQKTAFFASIFFRGALILGISRITLHVDLYRNVIVIIRHSDYSDDIKYSDASDH